MQCSVNHQDGKIVIFGHDYTLSNSNGLVESMVKPDLEAIVLESDNNKTGIKAIRQAGKTIRTFMESEIHQIAMSKVTKDEVINYTTLSTQTAESLSVGYLEAAVTAMDKLCKRMNKLHGRLWMIFGVLLGLGIFLTHLKDAPISGFIYALLIFIMTGWIKFASLNMHLFILGKKPLVMFAFNRGITYLKWYGWQFF